MSFRYKKTLPPREELERLAAQVKATTPNLFGREAGSSRIGHKFVICSFQDKKAVKKLFVSGGGQALDYRSMRDADALIDTVFRTDGEKYGVPTLHPQFLVDSARVGRLIDYREYVLTATTIFSPNDTGDESPAQENTDFTEDDIVVDIRRLYGSGDGGPLDAEDSMMDSFLSTQSRNISEYAVQKGPGSPAESQSTVSVEISDSDYRIRRTLDRSSRSLEEFSPMSASNSAMRSPSNGLASPEPQPASTRTAASGSLRSPMRNGSRRGALAANKSPSFIAARRVFESNQALDVDFVRTTSPELEMPETELPVTGNYAFIDGSSGGVSPELVGQASPHKKAAEATSVGDSLASDLSDSDYPDPLVLLEARNSNPRVTSPVRDNVAESTGTMTTGPGSESNGDQAGGDGILRRLSGRFGLTRLLGKRRRRSSNGSEYGQEAMPIVASRRGVEATASEIPDQQPPAETQAQSHATVRSHSMDDIATPAKRRLKTPVRHWSASKRIRMTGTESSESDPDSVAIVSAPVPLEIPADMPLAAPDRQTNRDNLLSSPEVSLASLAKRPGGEAQPVPDQAASLQVLAEESLGYPTANQGALQVSSLGTNDSIQHVSQTPDEPSYEAEPSPAGSPAPSSVSSSQSTVPIEDEAPEDGAADAMEEDEESPNEDVDDSDSDESNVSDASNSGAIAATGSSSPLPPRHEDDSWNPDANSAAIDSVDSDSDREADASVGDQQVESSKEDSDYAAPPSDAGTSEESSGREPSVALAEEVRMPAAEQGQEQGREVPSSIRARQSPPRVSELRRRFQEAGSATQPQPRRQRLRRGPARRTTMCQQLLELNSRNAGLDPPLSPLAQTPSRGRRGRVLGSPVIPAPSHPGRRATFSGAMRVLGRGEPRLTNAERMQYMRKVKGLIEGTRTSAKEALRALYFFTGNWTSARKYILHGESSLDEDCKWSPEEDDIVLQGLNSEQMERLRERKGNVEVYRRMQFLNTFHTPKE
ncbi:hypothetical protein GGF46_000040 [Coemansia sp. RSA 552]|nr:hypothetical protein GGF46_000040 [Coemansia sp. RSA 552]